MQVFVDDGVAIAARVDGASGDPIVLIHGFPLASEIWETQAVALSRAHRAIRVDLRGMGASSVPEGPYLMETLAADVAAVLDALGIERAWIAGHSLGGYVALAFARMFAERMRGLALVCSRLEADDAATAAARYELAERAESTSSMEGVWESFEPRLFAPQTPKKQGKIVENVRDIALRTNPRGAAAMLRGMAARDDATDIAPDLDMPVTIVAGGCDATWPLERARANQGVFPSASLVVCEASGHLPMLEEPGKVTEALERLLGG